MGWSCHLSGPAVTAKRILNANPEGRRNRGRLKLTWEDGVDDYVKPLGE
jgi:hypothetical protein